MDSSANAANDVEAMSIKEMKALITKAGLSHADCFEKSDLRQRAREAQIVAEAAQTSATWEEAVARQDARLRELEQELQQRAEEGGRLEGAARVREEALVQERRQSREHAAEADRLRAELSGFQAAAAAAAAARGAGAGAGAGGPSPAAGSPPSSQACPPWWRASGSTTCPTTSAGRSTRRSGALSGTPSSA